MSATACLIRVSMSGPENVVAGWLQVPVPPIPRQRHKPRYKHSRERQQATEQQRRDTE